MCAKLPSNKVYPCIFYNRIHTYAIAAPEVVHAVIVETDE